MTKVTHPYGKVKECKYCNSENLEVIVLPINHIHYAKLVCRSCGKFQKWMPKPKNQNSQRITRAGMGVGRKQDVSLDTA